MIKINHCVANEFFDFLSNLVIVEHQNDRIIQIDSLIEHTYGTGVGPTLSTNNLQQTIQTCQVTRFIFHNLARERIDTLKMNILVPRC